MTDLGRIAVLSFICIASSLLVGAGPPSARWLGQDGHDLVGKSAATGPSEVQDMHFVVAGLPDRAKVVSATVRGDGGGEWTFGGPARDWPAAVTKPVGATSADVYIEPYQVESGRGFEITLGLDDGRSATVRVQGGKANPNLRVASARLEARWVGQDGRDLVAPNPNAGPDGLQDACIRLARLAAKDEVRSILIAAPNGLRWQFGPNAEAVPRGELVRRPDDHTHADLLFCPVRDLAGQALKLTLTYESGAVDTASVTAGRCTPTLAIKPRPLPRVETTALTANWSGQRSGTARPGDVAVSIDGLPSWGQIVAVELSDGEVGHWSDRAPGAGKGTLPMTFRQGPGAARAQLSFPPIRDESGSRMTLRILFADGRSAVGSFPGAPCDPKLRIEADPGLSIVAKPGDDLNDLGRRFGTITLQRGEHRLRRPLVLEKPVVIRSEGGAQLVFEQAPGDPAWRSAIEIHAGRTTLEEFAIRFRGSIRWDKDVPYGPAIIGAAKEGLYGLRLSKLDIISPPAATAWEEAPRTLRIVGAAGGLIQGNRIEGGMIELWGGPWGISSNTFDGPRAGTFAHASLAIHEPHDLTIEKNQVRQADRAGKSWRWVVLTRRGSNVAVIDNAVEGIGPRDNDTHEHPNAPECILTESYRLSFEGKPSCVSADGAVLALPPPQGEPIRVGDVVAILSGPSAGEWRRVVLPLGQDNYLLDRPVTLGGGAIAVGPGFVATAFERNTIDDRGSKVAMPFVLAGQHFGTRLVGNVTRGGGVAARVVATGTESPGPWGWSHTAMFGVVVEGNAFEDSWQGSTLIVEHNALTRPSRGRLYMTARVASNLFSATPPFASSRNGVAPLLIGEPPSGDAGELALTASGNLSRGYRSATSARVRVATVNGKVVQDGRIDLPTSGASARGDAAPRR